MRRRHLAGTASAALCAVVAACQVIGVESGPTSVRGALYTDLRGIPCTEQMAPRELTGIGLRFLDASGRVMGTALTERARGEELPPRAGEGPEDSGCRFLAPYAVTLPTVPAYTVEFDVPDPPQQGGYFSGTDALTTQTLSREELAERDFTWSFELPPSYVVP